MREQLFDRAAEYEAMLNAGIGLSGESQQFFIEGRVRDLRRRVPAVPRRILDFGCGNGNTCKYLSQVFSQSHIVGADRRSTQSPTREGTLTRSGFNLWNSPI